MILNMDKDKAKSYKSSRVLVSKHFFKYMGAASVAEHSLYQCLKCATGPSQKPLSCYNKSRQNLKKHIIVIIFTSSIYNIYLFICNLRVLLKKNFT